jgi:hypothetical protein
MSEVKYVRTTPLPATDYAEARIRVTGMGFRFVTQRDPAMDAPAAHDLAVEKFQHHMGIDGKFQRLPSRDLDHGYRYELVDSNSKCLVCGSAI